MPRHSIVILRSKITDSIKIYLVIKNIGISTISVCHIGELSVIYVICI